MSQQSAIDFITTVSQDPDLLAQIFAAIGPVNLGTTGHATTSRYQEVVEIARKAGYEVDASDLEICLTRFVAEHPDLVTVRQLSDAELDLVAGGTDASGV